MKKIITFILTLIMAAMLFVACDFNKKSEAIAKTDFYFDTVISITVYDEEDAKVIDDCFDICKTYEELLSRSIESSDVSRVNSSTEPVEVDEKTAEVINAALAYCEESNGVFDISIYPLTKLWNITSENPKVPDENAIEYAKSLVDYKIVSVDGNTVSIDRTAENLSDVANAESSANASDSSNDISTADNGNITAGIDLGGIAKGFIADKLKEYLLSNGVESAIITLGGNVLLVGEKPDGSDFNVGVQKPFGQSGEAVCYIKAKDKSIVTSGIYERYFEEEGKLYHHILDTKTGYPVDNELASVTIISDSSTDGDAYSTTLLSMGLEKAKTFLKTLDGIEAVFITKDGEIILTDGLKIDSENVIMIK